ncbi:MAG: WbuC family cupin fold metalloprotein [Elsteraceae bacterium]
MNNLDHATSQAAALSADLTPPAGLVRESDEVFYAPAAISVLDLSMIDFLKRRSRANRRLRARICVHPSAQDGLHEMLIAHHRDVYVRPHWHIGKSESLHVVEGSARARLFDHDGALTQTIELGPLHSGKTYFYRIAERACHSLVIDSEWLLFHEVTSGPFNPAATIFPDWAPREDDLPGRALYDARFR